MQNCLPQKCSLEDNFEVGYSEMVFVENFPPKSLFVLFLCAGMKYLRLCHLDYVNIRFRDIILYIFPAYARPQDVNWTFAPSSRD